MAHLALPGTSGAYVSTPHSTAISFAGDFDVRVRLRVPAWPRPTLENIIAKWNGGAGGGRSYYLQARTDGRLHLLISQDGSGETAFQTSSVLSPTVNTWFWIRATADVDDGSGNRVVAYYTSTDDTDDPNGVAWTNVGATSGGVSSGTVSIFESTANLTIGAKGDTTGSQLLTADVRRAALYDGIAGTLVFDADPSDTTTWNCPAKDSFIEKANGATVTLQGDAELIGDCPSPGGGNRIGGTGAIRRSPVGR